MRSISVLIGLVTLTACSTAEEDIGANLRCEVGTYRMASNGLIDIGLSGAKHLRWRTRDGRVGRIRLEQDNRTWSGTTGWTDEVDPARIEMGDCADQSIRIAGIDGFNGSGKKVVLESTEVRFQGAGDALAGRLVMPPGEDRVPVVVLVHGSEWSSARDYAYHQRMLPAQGIGVFVYDKRGTGDSSGDYSQDFHLLAADAAAAHRTALEMAGERAGRSGYFGGSQGGWVAPLAASLSDVDFVISSFGMAEGPLAEDRDEIQLRLRQAGYGEATLAKAREVTDITGRLLVSDFQDGREDLVRIREAYGEEDWFSHIEGGISWDMVIRPLWQFRIGYFFLDVGTSWEYDPVPVIRAEDAPMLWVLAGADSSAPSAKTREILTQLQAEARPIDVAFFPNAEHGMIRFSQDESGQRHELGYATGYFPLLADWILNLQFAGAYDGVEWAPRRSGSEG